MVDLATESFQPDSKDRNVEPVGLVDRIVGRGQTAGVGDRHALGIVPFITSVGHHDHGSLAGWFGCHHSDPFVDCIVKRSVPAYPFVEKVNHVAKSVLVGRETDLFPLFQMSRVDVHPVCEGDQRRAVLR